MERSKIQVRKDALEKRSLLSNEERNNKNQIILNQIINSAEYKKADTILTYASYGTEVDTTVLINHALSEGINVYIPKVTGIDGKMDFFEIESAADLEAGYKGIPEPINSYNIFSVNETVNKCLMILPGVAFDKQGNRIGYGKGFYDRYLARCKEADTIYKMAIAYDCQMFEKLPSDELDIRMDAIITEKSVYVWN